MLRIYISCFDHEWLQLEGCPVFQSVVYMTTEQGVSIEAPQIAVGRHAPLFATGSDPVFNIVGLFTKLWLNCLLDIMLKTTWAKAVFRLQSHYKAYATQSVRDNLRATGDSSGLINDLQRLNLQKYKIYFSSSELKSENHRTICMPIMKIKTTNNMRHDFEDLDLFSNRRLFIC